MPVRDFVDSTGIEWRAWEVTPDAIYPPTRGEDYLADCYQLGWVVMETKSGDRRVRLCPIPREWHRLTDAELEALLEHGEVLPARTASTRGALADAAAVRTFRYPGGRVWTVSVSPHPTAHGRRVLRFSGGARVIDVVEWPQDWAELPDDALIAMLQQAAPRKLLGRQSANRRAGESGA
jgi:hypothetical protein